jgi:hypothetical protein
MERRAKQLYTPLLYPQMQKHPGICTFTSDTKGAFSVGAEPAALPKVRV